MSSYGALASRPTSQPGRLRRWIVSHDDSRLFVVLYIGLALVLSIFVSLFWLLAVVAVHALFELIRQHHLDAEPAGVLVRTAWETKLDVALVLFALALAVYLEFIFGIVGLGAAGRLGVQGGAQLARGGARFAIWQQVIKATLLSADDAAQVVRGIATRRRNSKRPGLTGPQEEPAELIRYGGWRQRWSVGDWLSIGLALACLGLLLGAPLITGDSPQAVLDTLLGELQPLP